MTDAIGSVTDGKLINLDKINSVKKRMIGMKNETRLNLKIAQIEGVQQHMIKSYLGWNVSKSLQMIQNIISMFFPPLKQPLNESCLTKLFMQRQITLSV